jgi:hypothetical protein
LIRRVRQAIADLSGIREMLANLQAWATIMQWQQDEDAKAEWRVRRRGEGTSLWEWLDFITDDGEIEWRGQYPHGVTGLLTEPVVVREQYPKHEHSRYWAGFQAGIQHEQRRRGLATT